MACALPPPSRLDGASRGEKNDLALVCCPLQHATAKKDGEERSPKIHRCAASRQSRAAGGRDSEKKNAALLSIRILMQTNARMLLGFFYADVQCRGARKD